jgi:Pyruvate/2-oxoacid:ferredoxin oxidoreductase gamma subunit
MPVDLSFVVGGEAGQGVQSVGFLLAKLFARGGQMRISPWQTNK